MFRILRKLKDLLISPGHMYLLPECIVVGLPLSLDSEYELQIHWSDNPKKTTTWAINVYAPDAVREPRAPGGFTFAYRKDNTALVTFDPTFFRLWTSGGKQDIMFSLYDKTNDIVVINLHRFIAKRGAANW